jgi:hypothetical protein
MAYNRTAALSYASQYYDKVCHDGKIALEKRVGGYPSTINNVKLTPGLPLSQLGTIADEGDCTHFLSCCVGQGPGGGINIQSPFAASGVYGETFAPRLVGALVIRGAKLVRVGTGPQSQFMDFGSDATKAAIQNLRGGDVLAYSDKNTLDRGGVGAYEHMALLLDSNCKIACHTSPRYGLDYTDVWKFTYVTLLKMP